MIWIIGTALVAIIGIALAAPLRAARTVAPAPAGAARDLAVYRDQLRGIEADAAAGRLGAEEAARLRAEVGRRLLEADRAANRTTPAAAAGPGPLALGLAMAGLAVLLAGGLLLYARLGAPDLPDAPRAARLEAAQERYAARPSQAEAEARTTPPAPPPEVPKQVLDLVEQLRTRMRQAPEPRGLRMLADYEARLGNFAAAQDAFRQVIATGDAVASDHVGLATLMIETAGGIITPESESEINAALALDAANPQARFLLGLLQGQTGRPDRTFEVWRALLEEGPPDAPWLVPIRENIDELAWLAGDPGYQPPPAAAAATTALPGPDADAMAAAQAMTPEARADMIADMVAGLEDRLAREGGSPEEWARLVTTLAVQGRADHAKAILAEARETFAGDPAALALLDQAAGSAGLAP